MIFVGNEIPALPDGADVWCRTGTYHIFRRRRSVPDFQRPVTVLLPHAPYGIRDSPMLPKEDFRLLFVTLIFLTLLVMWTWPTPTSFEPSPWVLSLTPPQAQSFR
jgi:hypothetical protein